MKVHWNSQEIAVRADRQVLGHNKDRRGQRPAVRLPVAECHRDQIRQELRQIACQNLFQNGLLASLRIQPLGICGELRSRE